MKLLYISVTDLMGQQFNGYLLHESMKSLGHQSDMAVAWRQSEKPRIHVIRRGGTSALDLILTRLEQRLSLYALLPVSTARLYCSSYYRNADILHLQLIQSSSFFSLFNIPIMSRRRPVVWTLHDPWPMSGHCVHPLDCNRWLTGCGECPDLTGLFPIRKDTTAFQWQLKKWVMANSRLTLVVASKWMYDRVRRSPILSHLPCHLIPFGVDANIFKPQDKSAARQALGIPHDAHVLCCRATKNYDYKGTIYIEHALKSANLSKPTYVITMNDKGALDSLRDRYRLMEFGWIEDQKKIAQILAASDLFLMPSIAESFGMMAVESMACATPVIAFDGTALTDTIDAPHCGIVVPSKDHEAFAHAIQELLEQTEMRQELGMRAANRVKNEYTLELYLSRHLQLYQDILSKSQ
ncbi:MAG TPA: glycosyltransferase [Syntrophorhabdales bacterium]|nr:glycosyltransferase [Syntrophorhabdales bacterium]